jgi:hypothetical protein
MIAGYELPSLDLQFGHDERKEARDAFKATRRGTTDSEDAYLSKSAWDLRTHGDLQTTHSTTRTAMFLPKNLFKRLVDPPGASDRSHRAKIKATQVSSSSTMLLIKTKIDLQN